MQKVKHEKVVTLEEILEVAQQLSLVDKVLWKEKIAHQIKRELQVVGTESQPRKSLRGLWRGLDITEEDIAEARQQM